MNRILLWVTAVLISLVLVLSWAAKSQYDRAQGLKAQNKVLTEAAERATAREKQDRKVLVARQAKLASTARKLAQAQQALSEALQRNPDWSNTNVPPDVQEALGGARSPVPDGL